MSSLDDFPPLLDSMSEHEIFFHSQNTAKGLSSPVIEKTAAGEYEGP